MLSVLDVPGVHVVPAAIDIGVDQTPEAQRWNDEPPVRQIHAPSFVQATNCALEIMVVPPDAGTLADRINDATARAELARIGETTAVDVISSAGSFGKPTRVTSDCSPRKPMG
jgi:hypothetical protein